MLLCLKFINPFFLIFSLANEPSDDVIIRPHYLQVHSFKTPTFCVSLMQLQSLKFHKINKENLTF